MVNYNRRNVVKSITNVYKRRYGADSLELTSGVGKGKEGGERVRETLNEVVEPNDETHLYTKIQAQLEDLKKKIHEENVRHLREVARHRKGIDENNKALNDIEESYTYLHLLSSATKF